MTTSDTARSKCNLTQLTSDNSPSTSHSRLSSMIDSCAFRLGDNKILAGASACFGEVLLRPKIDVAKQIVCLSD